MIGTVINKRYQLVAELGEGGMATVYLATDLNLQREVALKILHPHIARHEEFCRRFKQEAAIAARLVHPNIVQIYDYGTSEDERTFIVSELVRGLDFHQRQTERLRSQKETFPASFSAMVCEETLKALAAAHAMNFVHRDVKPDNIMISAEGSVKLTDFGIAKNLDSSMTVVGHFLGSPVYSSPEQIQGDKLDFRADIYAVGVILYEAITGRLPFNGNNASEVMMKIVGGKHIAANELVRGVPTELNEIIVKAMATQRELRFASAEEMGKALRSYLKGVGIENSRNGMESYMANPREFEGGQTKETSKPQESKWTDTEQKQTVQTEKNPIDLEPRKKEREQVHHRATVPIKKHNTHALKTTRQQANPQKTTPALLVLGIVVAGLSFVAFVLGDRQPTKNSGTRAAPLPTVTAAGATELPTMSTSGQDNSPQYRPKPAVEVTPPSNAPTNPDPKKVAMVRTPVATKKPTEIRVAMIPQTKVPILAATPAASPATQSGREAVKIAPRVTTGRIALQTIPAGANVAVDGKIVGSTGASGSLTPVDLKPGPHTVSVSSLEIGGVKYGGLERRVYVEAGKTTQVGALKLTPLRTLTLNIVGPSVTVSVNGDPYTLSGKQLKLVLPEGKVEIRAKASNGKTLERIINLKGDNFTINTSLE
jgi:serine/threonine protein kinase